MTCWIEQPLGSERQHDVCRGEAFRTNCAPQPSWNPFWGASFNLHPIPSITEGRGRRTLDAIETKAKDFSAVQHIASNGSADLVAGLPYPFREAVQNSQLFKEERRRMSRTTGCLSVLFPTDNTQDVSVTIWCGNDDGYVLTNFFGLQFAVSS